MALTGSAYRFFPLQTDPVAGFTLHPPDLAAMLEYAARRRCNRLEIGAKITPAGVCDAAEPCRCWREEVERARTFLVDFPRAEAGKAVLDEGGRPFRGDLQEFKAAMSDGRLVSHEGSIGGAWTVIIG